MLKVTPGDSPITTSSGVAALAAVYSLAPVKACKICVRRPPVSSAAVTLTICGVSQLVALKVSVTAAAVASDASAARGVTSTAILSAGGNFSATPYSALAPSTTASGSGANTKLGMSSSVMRALMLAMGAPP